MQANTPPAPSDWFLRTARQLLRGRFDGRWGAWSQAVAPGYACCERCRTPWRFVEEHCTYYLHEERPNALHASDVSSYTMTWGFFALCTGCWEEVSTEERVALSRTVWERGWKGKSESWDRWPLLEAAIRHES